jgi:hypothetical protein
MKRLGGPRVRLQHRKARSCVAHRDHLLGNEALQNCGRQPALADSAEANSILSIGLELPGSAVLLAGIASDAAYLLVIGALI